MSSGSKPVRELYSEGIWRTIHAVDDSLSGRLPMMKAFEVPFAGCLVQVITEHMSSSGSLVELMALEFVSGVCIKSEKDSAGIMRHSLAQL